MRSLHDSNRSMSTGISGAHPPWTRRMGQSLPAVPLPRGPAVERALEIPVSREVQRARRRALHQHTSATPKVQPRERAEALNRVVNVVLALVALTLLLPVLLCVALAIKLTSRGPVFYSHVRVGYDRHRTADHALYH